MAGTYLDRVSNKVLGQMLVERGSLSQAQISEALDVSKRDGIRLGEALVSLGFIGADTLSYVIAEQYGQRPTELHPSMLDMGLLAQFDINFLLQHTMLPLIDLGHSLVVVVGDPNELSGLDELSRMWPGGQIVPQLAMPDQIVRCLTDIRLRGSSSPIVRETPAPDSMLPRDIPDFEGIPSADASDFGVWLLRTAAENWGTDVIVRELEGGLQVALAGEELEELGRWPDQGPLNALNGLLQESKLIPYTDAQAYELGPKLVDGQTYNFMIAAPVMRGTSLAFIRALRTLDSSAYSDAPAEAFPQLPPAGQCVIVEYGDDELIDIVIARTATAHAEKHQVVVMSSRLRTAPDSIAIYPIPYTDTTSAAQAHRATAVIFDSPPGGAVISHFMAAMHPRPPSILVFLHENDADASDLLANRPGVQRVKLARNTGVFATETKPTLPLEKGDA